MHCNYMFPNWVQAGHIFGALNGDYSFWCPRQGIHVSPGQTKKPMRADTGIYVCINFQAMIQRVNVAWDHTTCMFVTNRPTIPT